MHTYNNLTEIAISDEILEKSFNDCIKGKKDRDDVLKLIEVKEQIKPIIVNLICNCKLKPVIHNAHEINDGFKQKKRIIMRPFLNKNNPEQWIQHIVINTLRPILMKGMYDFSCGSIPKRGIHYGKKYLEKYIRNNPKKIKYVLKLDIHHFYESVDIGILKSMFEKIIKDKVFLKLIFWVLDSNVGKFKDGRIVNKGLPIGYYTSQWFANFLLQPFDHFIKEILKADFYVRYMDDIVILGSNKRELHSIFREIEKYLKSLNLEVKSNWQIFRFDYIDKEGKRKGRHIDFMGFMFFRDKTTIRGSIFLRACRLARKLHKKLKISWRDCTQIMSYFGWFKSTDTFIAFEKYITSQINLSKCKTQISNHNKKGVKNENLQTGTKHRKTATNRCYIKRSRCIR